MVSLLTVLWMASGAGGADDDPVLRALTDEVARYSQLSVKGLEKPYYTLAAVADNDTFEVRTSFGAVVSRYRTGHASSFARVRVGSPSLDNTNFGGTGARFPMAMGHGASQVPWDRDYAATRQALWLDLDREYKRAAEEFAKKQAFLETNVVDDRPADFAAAPVSEVLLPRAALTVDEDRATALARKLSAVFRATRADTATAAVRADASNQTLATTDPVRDRFGETRITVSLRATAQADDGMEVAVAYDADGRTEADLPSEKQLLRTARELASRLEALTKAPVLSEEYTGPVLFTGRAAGWFFLKGVGEPLSHPRAPLDETKQTRLVDRLDQRIASSLVSLQDDPTQTSWKGSPLFGSFPVDDEGVKPQPVTLIEQGVLKAYYMSRTPTAKVATSNGHARGEQGGVGNLFVVAEKPESQKALQRELLALAKEHDQPYGLLIEDLTEEAFGGPADLMQLLRSRGATAGGDIPLPTPLVVRRVYADGHEELVRGVHFKNVSFRALRDIVGVGDSPSVLNTRSFGQSVSVVSPAVLVKELDLQGPTAQSERPAALPRPPVSASIAGGGQ